ncbi:3-hydroxyacyl-CoA dehydrogenase [Lentinula aff. detonsa]|uniref:3-hydroxyacyl-CoA dehydrogenase n=1 Tax=Lentinula aff. detonsa TaxID=2804958 RepID=A0AA38KAL9_9AGAR|nr:3-hydroxyacyl-CoA dehydrogenase [Lentinula aff. detonsa]KAJ3801103.1 3-hydroxyacyl-CoA dehydrogenase [Lentinula aff. detonsa]
MKINNRTFIVSGGSSGLGLATVQMLVQAQSHVSIFDRSPPPSTVTGPQIKFCQTDITIATEIEKAIEETVSWTKQTKAILGGVINCAGVGAGAKIIDAQNQPHSLDLWDFVLAVNLTGTFNLTRLALQHMVHNEPEEGLDGERGVIILVSSSAAFEGQPGQAAYSATKGALRSMTLPLARDLARHSIRVMTIAPNMFVSSMTENLPQKVRQSLENDLVYPKRFGQPVEFAETVKWILECAYINGETVRLSGASRMPAKM